MPHAQGQAVLGSNMETERLLDQSRKFVVVGPDEKIWFFAWESSNSGIGNAYSWQAYSRKPGITVYLPEGPWSEASVLRFLNKHSRKLTDSDRIDLFLYLHRGGLEAFLHRNRTKETHDSRR